MTSTNSTIIEFVAFILKKVYKPIPIDNDIINTFFLKIKKDINYYFLNLTEDDIIERIVTNQNELAIFLFRIGNELHLNQKDSMKHQIHALLREMCACEIYFNNSGKTSVIFSKVLKFGCCTL